MKRPILLAVFALLASPAFAKEWKCRAADGGNKNPKAVPVNVLKGAQVKEDLEEIKYGAYRIKVVHNVGDRRDAQSMFTITANDHSTRIYNVSEDGLYQHLAKDLFIQCYFE